MIEPNFNIFLWTLLIIYGCLGVSNIIMGATGYIKSKNYSSIDAFTGLIMLFIVFLVCIL